MTEMRLFVGLVPAPTMRENVPTANRYSFFPFRITKSTATTLSARPACRHLALLGSRFASSVTETCCVDVRYCNPMTRMLTSSLASSCDRRSGREAIAKDFSEPGD
ncbi:hypothetical protein [Pseudosulfitobacter koreensis]|uniref:Uncharacterized protein n=1 Tax=Pseudosulfitobacter koreensis TaxID=2968472 RepID=A0ABT1Z430_9RHOB|nr:hypothetical protein [Pseudosulfitobacter koreense]MCR8827863.1 hypothetical protein [Pseudosulfitobacter koreense]